MAYLIYFKILLYTHPPFSWVYRTGQSVFWQQRWRWTPSYSRQLLLWTSIIIKRPQAKSPSKYRLQRFTILFPAQCSLQILNKLWIGDGFFTFPWIRRGPKIAYREKKKFHEMLIWVFWDNISAAQTTHICYGTVFPSFRAHTLCTLSFLFRDEHDFFP